MKKGIELSMNFLVTIIIALTIFMFGVRFIYTLASEAVELESLTTDQLDIRIGELLCESTDRVCIGIDKKIIRKGKFDVFGIKIINIQDSKTFDITITPTGFTKDNEPVSTVGLDKITVKYNPDVFIDRNEEKSIGVGVEVAKDARQGTYILDVSVQPYDTLHKIYVEVP